MTTKIDKNGNRWQFISDENDIETIMEKLDWIAASILKLRFQNDGITGPEIDQYNRIFNSISQEIPKE